jgi:hypothetical protein
MRTRKLGLCATAALFVSCMVSAQDAAAPATPVAGDAGAGTVIFFREKKMVGAAIRFKVRENGVELCKLGSGTLTMDVKPGETYYVVSSISMGAFAGHPKLTVTDKTTFDGMKDKLKDNTGKDLKTKDDK